MSKHISDERKDAYYLGMGFMILGFLLFASTFVTSIANFGNFGDFQSCRAATAPCVRIFSILHIPTPRIELAGNEACLIRCQRTCFEARINFTSFSWLNTEPFGACLIPRRPKSVKSC